VIEIKIDDKGVTELLKRLEQKTRDLSPAMKVVSEIMRTAVINNFEEGGRPRWKPSKRAIKEGGQTLIDTSRLMKSITAGATATQAAVGTNVIYAAIHQFGGVIKAHTVRARNAKALAIPTKNGIIFRKSANIPQIAIPARPFLKLTDSDLDKIKQTILSYLTK